MTEHPLVSFVLLCYRQERFIREALEGALAQTYQPLQIVVSDDASPDNTYNLVLERAKHYKGPHKIILQQNKENLGLTGNFNEALHLASGELVVMAAGDDVSLPERTARIVARWVVAGRPRGSLCSAFLEVDSEGHLRPAPPPGLPPSPLTLTGWIQNPHPLVFGATQAFHRDLFRVFGPLLPGRSCEDAPLGMRALALDGVTYLEEVLVQYRRHEDNLNGFIDDATSPAKTIQAQARRLRNRVDIFSQVLGDMDHPAFLKKWGREDVDLARMVLRRAIREGEVLFAWASAGEAGIGWDTVWKAWHWPPMIGVGCRLAARRIFPGLQRFLLARQSARWRQRLKGSAV